MDELVLVAGATGRLGREVVRELTRRECRVRAMGRSMESLARLVPEADEIVVADAFDQASLLAALVDVERVFSCMGASVIPLPRYGARTFSQVDTPTNVNLIDSAVRHGVRKFLYVSVFGADKLPHRDFVVGHERVVEHLRGSGLPYAVVRPTGFFQSMEEIVLVAGSGLLPQHKGGTARTNPIHETDLARFCVEALLDPDPALERDVGGPDALMRCEIAALAERSLLGRRRLRHVPVWVMRAAGLAAMPLYPRVGELMAFIADILMDDFVAPAYGDHHIEDYFAERARERDGELLRT